jgi:hypothetical protein
MTLSTATIVNVLAAGDAAKAIQIRTVKVTAAYCHRNRPYPKPLLRSRLWDRMTLGPPLFDPFMPVANGS